MSLSKTASVVLAAAAFAGSSGALAQGAGSTTGADTTMTAPVDTDRHDDSGKWGLLGLLGLAGLMGMKRRDHDHHDHRSTTGGTGGTNNRM